MNNVMSAIYCCQDNLLGRKWKVEKVCFPES